MFEKVILSIYTGILFCIVFIVAPILLRVSENKNIAGHFYGRILWRFYKLAFLTLMFYLLLADDKAYALLLMAGLALNTSLSIYLRNLKKSIGDIDKVPYYDGKRVKFRKLSFLSTLMLFINLVLSILVYIKTFGGGNGV